MAILFRNDCVLCAKPLPQWDGMQLLCERCVPRVDAMRCREALYVQGIDAVASVFYYKGEMAGCIKRYKFQGQKQYAQYFAQELSKLLEQFRLEWKPDVITYIPIGFSRARERGFNQSKLIAKRLAKQSGVPCRALLHKRAWVSRQSGTHSAEERFANAKEAFNAPRGADYRGMKILIIDDVLTTGATLGAAQQVLRDAGAGKVYALTIAKTKK